MGKGLEEARAALSLAFAAVNSASDAFPPLKSVSGGLLFCVQLAQTVQSNKRDYAQLLKRIAGIAHDLANGDDSQSSSDRTAVGSRVDAFRRCLEKLQEDLEVVDRRGRCALRANQHKEIIRSCNEELDRFTWDFGVWANLLLIRHSEAVQHRPAALTDADLARVTAVLSQQTAILSQQLSTMTFRPPPLPDPPDPPNPVPKPNGSDFHFSASRKDGVKLNLHIRPTDCVLFAYEVRGGGL